MTKAPDNFNLKNNIGETLQLQFSPGNDRYYVKLIGYVENKCIIVTTPFDQEQPIRIPDNQVFVVRLVSGTSVSAFTAHALHITTYPFPHLHLSFPNNIESINVRKSERIKCNIIVTAQNEESGKNFDNKKSALIPNISKAGAQLLSAEELGNVGDKILLSSKISVAELEEQYMNISAIIRRADEINDKTSKYDYGLQFTFDGKGSNDKDKLLLYNFIYEKMLEGSH